MRFDQIWARDLHQRPLSHPILSPDLIVVPERQTRLAALDPATGQLRWQASVPYPWGWLAATTEVKAHFMVGQVSPAWT